MKTYNEAIVYLKSFIPFTLYNTDAYKKTATHDPLDRMRYLLKLLYNPEKKFKSVLVGGTSGKGSTSYLISHILTTAGYKTGLTLSPHLVRINERIQINNKEISNADFVQLIQKVQPIIKQMKESELGAPSYFEIIIGMAFLYFAKQKVDLAIVEVGMGGTYDATNVLEPLIAVLTNVTLDHTQFLGETVEEIAETKVGIIKNYELRITNYERPVVVTGVTQPSVIKIVEDRCKLVGEKLFRLGKDFNFFCRMFDSWPQTVFDFTRKQLSSRSADRRGEISERFLTNVRNDKITNMKLSLLGHYQVENATLAIETIKQLHHFGFSVSEQMIRKALQTAYFPGRFEIISSSFWGAKRLQNPDSGQALRQVQDAARMTDNMTLILDGAHNPAKMHAFVDSLQKVYPKKRKVFVIAFKKDKNIEDMLKEITPVADAIIATEFQIGTDTMIKDASYDASNLKSQISNLKFKGKVVVEKDCVKALEKAMELATAHRHSGEQRASRRSPTGDRIDSGQALRQAQDAARMTNSDSIIIITGSLYLIGEIKQRITF